ncbi:MAG: hypothetical protein CM15mP77_2870 [Synechococcus sp.]|nr:MAG: hypothetical protein CM15mP77_2870 [Synechococcus sp.]
MAPKTASTCSRRTRSRCVYATLEPWKPKAPRPAGRHQGSSKGKLRADRDNAYLPAQAGEILVDVPLPKEPSLPLSSVDADGLSSCLEDLELNSLLRQVGGFVAAFSEGDMAPMRSRCSQDQPPISHHRTAAEEAATEPATQDDWGCRP